MNPAAKELVSSDNHAFPVWVPDWLRDQVAAPDCSTGTHYRLRWLARWLVIYFSEQQGIAKRWLYHAAQYCDRDVPDDEIDRLLSWAEGLFGQGHAGLISVAHTQISRKFMPSPQAALISRSIAHQARNGFTTSRYGRLSRFCKIGAVTVAKTIRSSASALTTVSGRDRSAR